MTQEAHREDEREEEEEEELFIQNPKRAGRDSQRDATHTLSHDAGFNQSAGRRRRRSSFGIVSFVHARGARRRRVI